MRLFNPQFPPSYLGIAESQGQPVDLSDVPIVFLNKWAAAAEFAKERPIIGVAKYRNRAGPFMLSLAWGP
jgi:hypothetical protein